MLRIFLALWLALAPASAWAGSVSLLGVGKPPTAAAAYTGPGDIVSGAAYWYGLRGYSAAYASPGTNCAVDIEDQSGANPLTCIHILSNGNLDVATIITWVAAHSVTTIKISQLYDQTGNGIHLVQATLANMPVLVLSGLGSLPLISFTGSSTQVLQSSFNAAPTEAQPFTMSAVFKNTNSSYAGGWFAASSGSGSMFLGNNGANTVDLQCGSDTATTATDNAFHSVQAVGNGASSTVKIDSGSLNTVSAGTSSAGQTIILGGDQFSNRMTGNILEAGLWPSAISSANQTSLSSNQHTYWGF